MAKDGIDGKTYIVQRVQKQSKPRDIQVIERFRLHVKRILGEGRCYRHKIGAGVGQKY